MKNFHNTNNLPFNKTNHDFTNDSKIKKLMIKPKKFEKLKRRHLKLYLNASNIYTNMKQNH